MRRHEFEKEVDHVIETLPSWVLERVDNLAIVVEDHPSEDQGDVLGIYEGVSLAERGEYWGALPDQIIIFYQPHVSLGLGNEELRAEIRRTVLHELGHHLGIDDDRLADLGWD